MKALILTSSIAALFLIMSCMIRYGKAYGLISGYNTMSPEEKARVNKEKMGKIVSTGLFAIAVLVAAGGFLFYQNLDTWGWIAFLLILPVTFFIMVQSQKCSRGNSPSEKKTKMLDRGILIFALVVIASVACVLSYGARPADYSLNGKILSVSGLYGTNIDLSGAKSISLENTLPTGSEKTNGFDWNTIKKGNFRCGTLPITLYVDTSVPKYIVVNFTSSELIVNCSTQNGTQALYNKLKSVIS